MATLATSSAQSLPRVILVEDLYKPSMTKREVIHVHQVRVGPSWMDPLVLFLMEDILAEEKTETDKIRWKASRFWLSEDQKLYKHSFFGPYLLYVHPEASELILEDLHSPLVTKREAIHVHQVRVRPSWMDPLVLFLKDDILLEEKIEADKIRRKASQFWLSEDRKSVV